MKRQSKSKAMRTKNFSLQTSLGAISTLFYLEIGTLEPRNPRFLRSKEKAKGKRKVVLLSFIKLVILKATCTLYMAEEDVKKYMTKLRYL